MCEEGHSRRKPLGRRARTTCVGGRVGLALFLRLFTRSQVSQLWEGFIGHPNDEQTFFTAYLAERVRLTVELASDMVLNNEKGKKECNRKYRGTGFPEMSDPSIRMLQRLSPSKY